MWLPRGRAGRELARWQPWWARWNGGAGVRRKAGALNRGGPTSSDDGVAAPVVVRPTREGRPRMDRWAERCASSQYGADDAPARGAVRTPSIAGRVTS
jgi:hypothetical protein